MKENNILKEMEYEDIEEIARIENEIFSDAWSKKSIEYEYKNNNTKIFIAKHKQKVLGYVFFSTILDEAEIMNIAVDAKCRGQKIATRLMKKIIKEISLENISKILLEVRKSNVAAIKLYNKFGFVQNGLRKNYYQEPKEDAILMIKNVALAT